MNDLRCFAPQRGQTHFSERLTVNLDFSWNSLFFVLMGRDVSIKVKIFQWETEINFALIKHITFL